MTDTETPSALIATAQVRRIERLSPAFVRVTLGSPAFTDLGIEGFDARFKLIFPNAAGDLPQLAENSADWYAAWMSQPEDSRNPMRTYTVRDVLDEADERLLVVDLVVHEEVPDASGHTGAQGPACRWALAAQPGDELQVIAPHRLAAEYGGTEFAPGECTDLLLVGDETAVPAVTRILADLSTLPSGSARTGHVFLEVPAAEDVVPIEVPPGVELTWLPRKDATHGRRLVDAVRAHLGLGPLDPAVVADEVPSDLEVEVWETIRHSSAGEDVAAQLEAATRGSDLPNLYAWIAGESWLVKALRRTLVSELDVERRRVAFMGYWREGVAMKS